MSIAVQCGQCGKAFKAKDELGGKVVRCPSCKEPLRIPAAGAPAAAPKSSAPPPKSSAPPAQISRGPAPAAAAQKVEAARAKRMVDAETEAAQRAEVNKLVQAWDQLSGKDTKQKAKQAKPGEVPAKETIATRVQDRVGMFKSTLLWKYVLLALFLAGGGYGSTVFIGKIMSHTEEATAYVQKDAATVEQLYERAEKAAAAARWGEVKECLDEIIRIQPHRVNNLRFRDLKKALEDSQNP